MCLLKPTEAQQSESLAHGSTAFTPSLLHIWRYDPSVSVYSCAPDSQRALPITLLSLLPLITHYTTRFHDQLLLNTHPVCTISTVSSCSSWFFACLIVCVSSLCLTNGFFWILQVVTLEKCNIQPKCKEKD